MKVILNSPYDGSLHLKILREAMKHSDDIVNLSPIRWLQDIASSYKVASDYERFADVREHIKSIDIISVEDVVNHFDVNFMSDLGIYTLDNQVHNQEYLVNKTFFKIFNKDIYKNNLIRFNTHKNDKVHYPEYFAFPAVFGSKKDKSACCIMTNKMEANFERVADNEKAHGMHLEVWLKSYEEKVNFYKSFFTKFYKYCILNLRCNGNVIGIAQFLPYLNDYSHPWTDADLYKYFDLTDEEIETIEKEMAKYK